MYCTVQLSVISTAYESSLQKFTALGTRPNSKTFANRIHIGLFTVTEATNVIHVDGISRHRLRPYDVHTLQYKYDNTIARPTVRFPVPVKTDRCEI